MRRSTWRGWRASMADPQRRRIGVIAERQDVDNPWIDHRWRVTGLLPGAPAVPDWTCLAHSASVRRYYAGSAELLLFPRETDTLKYNIEGVAPAVYVFLRAAPGDPGMALAGATVCVGEAHAHADTGSDLVEPVPMPADIHDWVAAFVAAHHVERDVWKRKREGVREDHPRRSRR
jgi:hypothetical protein